MFSGFACDSVALSHVQLDLPDGRFRMTYGAR